MPELTKAQVPLIIGGLFVGALLTLAVMKFTKSPCGCEETE